MDFLPDSPNAGVGGAVSGKVGSVVFSHGPHGPYSYTFSARTDPNTPSQQSRRLVFAVAARTWSVGPLPEWIRTPWETYAKNVPEHGRLGRIHHPTGFNRFVGVIAFKSFLGIAFNLYAPEIYTHGKLTAPGYSEPLIGRRYTRVKVSFDLSDPWRFSDFGVFALFASRPQPSTVKSFTGPYQYAGHRTGHAGTPPTQAVFLLPFEASAGMTIWFRARVAEPDNRLSPPVAGSLLYV